MFRKVLILTCCFWALSFVVVPKSAFAAIVVVRPDGEVVFNVLADEDAVSLDIPQSSFIEVNKAAKNQPEQNAQIKLSKDNDKISLAIDGESSYKEVDVSGWNSDVIEMEERPQTQKLNIGIYGGKFGLQQQGVLALTDLPVKVDTKEARIELTTARGDQLISVLPYQAAQTALRTKLVTTIGDPVELYEDEKELAYRFRGEKLINFFGVYYYPLPVVVDISASTGELIKLEEPSWLRGISFFLG